MTIYLVNPSYSGYQGGSINGTAAGLSHRNPQATGNMGPVNHSILLPIEKQGIHKTSEGETKWKISERNKDTTFQSSRFGFWKNRKLFLGLKH